MRRRSVSKDLHCMLRNPGRDAEFLRKVILPREQVSCLLAGTPAVTGLNHSRSGAGRTSRQLHYAGAWWHRDCAYAPVPPRYRMPGQQLFLPPCPAGLFPNRAISCNTINGLHF